jgi:hypothetical protein
MTVEPSVLQWHEVQWFWFAKELDNVEEPVPDSLSFKQLSMACIETCLRNVWHLKIKSVIGPLSIIGTSTLLLWKWISFGKIVDK